MHKEAWTYSLAGTVLGAFGLLLRWLQCEIIYDETTGLPAANAPISYLLVIYMAAMAAALWWLSGKMGTELASEEPDAAMARTGKLVNVLLVIAALAVGAGSGLMLLTEDDLAVRIAALLGILSAPVLATYPSLPRWGGFGAALSLIPVVFFSLWITTFYRGNAINPVVWDYGLQILAIAGGLMAMYRLSGYLFYRASPRQTIYACALGLAVSLTVLMDNAALGTRVLFVGWSIGLGVLCWVLLRNFGGADSPEEQNVE